jgi:hypothetical protein
MRPPPRIFNFGHSSPPQSGRGILADSSKKKGWRKRQPFKTF